MEVKSISPNGEAFSIFPYSIIIIFVFNKSIHDYASCLQRIRCLDRVGWVTAGVCDFTSNFTANRNRKIVYPIMSFFHVFRWNMMKNVVFRTKLDITNSRIVWNVVFKAKLDITNARIVWNGKLDFRAFQNNLKYIMCSTATIESQFCIQNAPGQCTMHMHTNRLTGSVVSLPITRQCEYKSSFWFEVWNWHYAQFVSIKCHYQRILLVYVNLRTMEITVSSHWNHELMTFVEISRTNLAVGKIDLNFFQNVRVLEIVHAVN